MQSKETEIGNIGEKETARLRGTGILILAFAAALGTVAINYQVSSWVRLILFMALWSGASALLQAKERTSILLAARRVRRIDGKEEPENYVITVRERARMIRKHSFFVAVVVMTLVTILSPMAWR